MIYAKLKSPEEQKLLEDELRSAKDRNWYRRLRIIERLWHYMRDNITRSIFYKTLDKLCEALIHWLREIPFERFWSLMGLSP